MIQFPLSTTVNRIIPKEAFYKRLTLCVDLKEKFVTDVQRITLSNSLTSATLNLELSGETEEILILTIDLKKREFDGKIVESIARQNKHKLVFVLRYEKDIQLAVFYNKLYVSEWAAYDYAKLEARGNTLDAVWQGFLEQIALQNGLTEHKSNESIDMTLQRQEEILKLQKEIARLEKQIQSEIQPKKKFELYGQLQEKKQKLEDLIHG